MTETKINKKDQKTKTSKMAIWSFIIAATSCAPLITISILLVIPPLPKSFEWLYHLIPSLTLIFLSTYTTSLVLGICSISEIRKSILKGIMLSVGTIIIDVILIIGIILVFLLILRPISFRMTCGSNLAGLGTALKIYSYEFDGKYPTPSKWCDLLIKHAEVTEKSFHCPGNKKVQYSYGINPNAEPNAPPDIVLLFDSIGGRNQHGGPELLNPTNHIGKGCNILFNNGEVQFVRAKQFSELKWNVHLSDSTAYIHHVVWIGNIEKVLSMLEEKADLVHTKNIFGQTPLHTSVLSGNIDIVELMISKGARDNADNRYRTPIHAATSKGRKDIVGILLAVGFDPDPMDGTRTTPLHLAALWGHKEIAQLLIANGANVNARDDMGWTPLKHAVFRNQTELSELLRKYGGHK